jgi:hypothetical protein
MARLLHIFVIVQLVLDRAICNFGGMTGDEGASGSKGVNFGNGLSEVVGVVQGGVNKKVKCYKPNSTPESRACTRERVRLHRERKKAKLVSLAVDEQIVVLEGDICNSGGMVGVGGATCSKGLNTGNDVGQVAGVEKCVVSKKMKSCKHGSTPESRARVRDRVRLHRERKKAELVTLNGYKC